MAVAPNIAQVDFWNATAGQTWVAFDQLLDRQLEPLGREAMRVLNPTTGDDLMDVGCGCGHSAMRLAERVGASGSVLGVDISKPMLAVANRRVASLTAATTKFLEADAQTHDFGDGVFDGVFSRFGVMFFSDPVSAFRNIRRSLKPGGRVTFVCWRNLSQNPWMGAPMDAARPYLPPLAHTDPLAPGPFAFADQDRVRSILATADFDQIAIMPFDTQIGGSGLEDTLSLTFKVGPLGAALREHPNCLDIINEPVRAETSRYLTDEGVFMPAAVWIVSALRG